MPDGEFATLMMAEPEKHCLMREKAHPTQFERVASTFG
jgi:hypothetical protein